MKKVNNGSIRKPKKEVSEYRWMARVTYRQTKKKNKVFVYEFNELYELDDLIENGPNWYAMRDCVVTLNWGDGETLKELME